MKKILIGVLIVIVIGSLLISQKINKENQIGKLDTEENLSSENIDNKIKQQDIIRTDSKGSVDIVVAFNNIIEENDKYLIFEMYLNTHSVDLENIKFADLATIRTSNNSEIKDVFMWEIIGGSGHHIEALLKVPKIIDGDKIINESTEYLELELKNIGGVDYKKFIWDKEILNKIDID